MNTTKLKDIFTFEKIAIEHQQEIFYILQNEIFPDSWTLPSSYDLATLYFCVRSGNKTVSKIVKNYTEVYDLESEFDLFCGSLAALISSYFLDKWQRFYNALNVEYNPIANYDMEESETTATETTAEETQNFSNSQESEIEETYTKTGTEQNSNTGLNTTEHITAPKNKMTSQTRTPNISETETTTFAGSKTTEETPTGGRQMTTQTSNTTAQTDVNAKFPFNAANTDELNTDKSTQSGSGSATSTETESFTNRKNTTTESFNSRQDTRQKSQSGSELITTTESGTLEENTTENVSGSATTTYNTTDTQSTNTNTTSSVQGTKNNTGDESVNRTLTRRGNIGVTTTQQMIESELELRKNIFIEQIFKDIDTILTIPIYE